MKMLQSLADSHLSDDREYRRNAPKSNRASAKLLRVLGAVWLAAASITWALCPSPTPMAKGNNSTVQYADLAGYYIECLSMWPLIAYSTLLQNERS
jgi:hypothetical protein